MLQQSNVENFHVRPMFANCCERNYTCVDSKSALCE